MRSSFITFHVLTPAGALLPADPDHPFRSFDEAKHFLTACPEGSVVEGVSHSLEVVPESIWTRYRLRGAGTDILHVDVNLKIDENLYWCIVTFNQGVPTRVSDFSLKGWTGDAALGLFETHARKILRIAKTASLTDPHTP